MASVETLKVNITADNSNAIKGVREVKNNIDGLKESIKVYQDQAFAEKDIAKLKNYNYNLQQLQAQLKQTANVGKVGFDEMGVAIQKASGNPMTQAFSGLRQIAYILPGIGIAGIFNLAFEGIEKAAEGLVLFSSKSKEAEAATKKLNQEITSTREAAEKDVSSLRSLINAAQDHALSLEKRKHAVRELQDLYPGYFKDLSKEQILNGNLVDVTNQLTAAIYKRAAARVLETQIAEKATQVFLNQQKIEKLNLDIAQQSIRVAQSNKTAAGPLPLGAAASDNAAQIRQGTVIDDTKKLNELIGERTQLNTRNLQLTSQVSKLQGDANKLVEETLDLDKKDIAGKKEKEDAYNSLLDKLAHIQAEYKQGIIDNAEYNKKSISDIIETSKHLSLQSEEYKKAIALLKEYYTARKDNTNPTTRFAQATDRQFSGDSADAPTRLSGVGKFGSGVFDKEFEKFNDDSKKNIDSFNERLKITQQLAFGIGDAFSKAIESGQSLGESLKTVFADLAQQIERALIKALLLKSIGGLFGLTGLGSIGDIFKNILGGGKGFAAGGLSTGPESGHIELLHGNEWVMRPNQINDVISAARQSGVRGSLNTGIQQQPLPTPTLFMKGADFWLMYQQAQRFNQRGY